MFSSCVEYLKDTENYSLQTLYSFINSASLKELAIKLDKYDAKRYFVNLIEIGINQDRKIWFVMDELASVGKIPSLSTIMSEGRKYGACVLVTR